MKKICLSVILFLTVIIMFLSSKGDKRADTECAIPCAMRHRPDTAIKINERTILLIENILNLPSVIKFSRIESVRRDHESVYGRVYGLQLKKDSIKINQHGENVILLRSMDSISTRKEPCFVFSKLIIQGDTAEVRLNFAITGFLAFGKMYYKQGRWYPTRTFRAGRT